MARRLKKKNIRNIPPEIKGAVVEYAAVNEKPIYEVVPVILAGYFSGALGSYTPTWDPVQSGGGNQIHFYCTSALDLKLWRASGKTGETESSFMIGVLAQFFGLEYEPVMKGGKYAAAT